MERRVVALTMAYRVPFVWWISPVVYWLSTVVKECEFMPMRPEPKARKSRPPGALPLTPTPPIPVLLLLSPRTAPMSVPAEVASSPRPLAPALVSRKRSAFTEPDRIVVPATGLLASLTTSFGSAAAAGEAFANPPAIAAAVAAPANRSMPRRLVASGSASPGRRASGGASRSTSTSARNRSISSSSSSAERDRPARGVSSISPSFGPARVPIMDVDTPVAPVAVRLTQMRAAAWCRPGRIPTSWDRGSSENHLSGWVYAEEPLGTAGALFPTPRRCRWPNTMS